MTTPRFTVIDAPQRSPQWHAARAGRLTGSRAVDMLATIKSGEAAGRRNLRAQLVLERITSKAQDNGFTSAAMQQGIDREVDAYAAYQVLTGQELVSTGFLSSTDYMAGCSLDGHVGQFEGIIEIKCPLPATHLEYLKSGNVPGNYLAQITHNLWVSGAEWCDWLSFQPDFPEGLQVQMVRVLRDPKMQSEYEQKALEFLSEVDHETTLVSEMMRTTSVWRGAKSLGVL